MILGTSAKCITDRSRPVCAQACTLLSITPPPRASSSPYTLPWSQTLALLRTGARREAGCDDSASRQLW